MNVTIGQKALADALGIVGKSVAGNSSLPVLSHILLEASSVMGEGVLTLKATNLEVSAVRSIPATVEKLGAFTVPAKLFIDLVNQSPEADATISLNYEKQEIRYTCGAVNSTIKGIRADEFPDIPTPSDHFITSLPSFLIKAIDRVAFSAAADQSRPLLTGVLFDVQDDKVVLAAADGFRLSTQTVQLAENTDKSVRQRYIIPSKALQEVSRVIKGDIGMFAIYPNGSSVPNGVAFVSVDPEGKTTTRIHSQLIDGNYPDYRQIIPKKHEIDSYIDPVVLAKTIKRAFLFARDAANIVRIVIGDDVLTIRADAQGTGEFEEVIPARVEGVADSGYLQNQQVALNGKYLLDMLGAIAGTGQVRMQTGASTNPVAFKIEGESFVHVIMPMHTGAR